MDIIQKPVFVVIRLTRGRPDVIAAFNEADHGHKFIKKLASCEPGIYSLATTSLWDFMPSEDEIVIDYLTEA